MSRHFSTTPYMFAPNAQAVQDLYDRLTALAKAAVAERQSTSGTFAQNTFRSALHQVIDIIDAETGPQRSVGVAWLSYGQNRVLFRQIIPAEECLAFFKAHLTNEHVLGMLEYHATLRLIPEDSRADFVRSALGHWIPATDAWISGARSAQVNIEVLKLSVLHWLGHPTDFEGSDTFAARFLRTGPGPARKDSCWTLPHDPAFMWSLFTDDEGIQEALMLCADQEPNVFFEAPAANDLPVSRKVQLRLDNDQAAKVLGQAISKLESREGLSAAGFDCLAKRVKLSVIRLSKVCPLPLLVKVALDYIDLDGLVLFNANVGLITPNCTDYAADLVESFGYIHDIKLLTAGGPYVSDRIARIEQTLLRNAAMHGVDPSTLEL